MTRVTPIDIGTVMSEMAASSGLIHSIIPSTPTIVSAEVSSWLSPCCSVVVTLSMSLVTRLSRSPCGWLSKYCRGSRAQLRLDVAAHAVHRALRDARP